MALPPVVGPLPDLAAAAVTEQALLDLHHGALVTTLGQRWSVTRHADPGPALAALAADTLNQALHALSAALLTGDTRPVSETAQWIAAVLAARGVATAAVPELAGLLIDVLDDSPLARQLVQQHFTVETD